MVCSGDWKSHVSRAAPAQRKTHDDSDINDSAADAAGYTEIPEPGVTFAFKYSGVLLFGHPYIMSQAKGGHVVGKVCMNYGEQQMDLKLGLGIWAGVPKKLFAVACAEVNSDFIIEEGDARVRTTIALRCFEDRVDGRGAAVKYTANPKEMHAIAVSDVAGASELSKNTIDAAKLALEKWKSAMFEAVGLLGKFLEKFNQQADLGGSAQQNTVATLNADACVEIYFLTRARTHTETLTYTI